MSNDKQRHAEAESSARAGDVADAADPSPPPMRVVGIGASAGGLEALKTLFSSVPEQPGVCFVVVVHLSAEHESHLAPLLQPQCRIPVQQVTGATPLEVNHVYVIPPGANIDAIDSHLRLSELESNRRERAAIDHFFSTLAQSHQEQAIGVVLTGTGSDGTAGLRRIRERGGLTVVQSPDEAEYDAMPRNAVAAGVADLVLPLDQIIPHILAFEQTPPLTHATGDEPLLAEGGEKALQDILAHVRSHTRHDFCRYKRATILRRIRRRMELRRAQDLETYLGLLQDDDAEVELLFEDLLITVTEFFRDPEVFAHLESQVIPELFKNRGPADRVRAWSVGCATGEEAYSLAMLLMEAEARQQTPPRQVQVFASDLHEPALRKAREGIYPASIEAHVTKQRLDRFFEHERSGYRIKKSVRERLIYARHNILQDPPFSHVQLICCRNVLIYLQRDAQRHLTSLFHYALENDGYLLVGTAEAIDTELFVCEDKKHGLYRRRNVPAHKPPLSIFPLTQNHSLPDHPLPASADPSADFGAMHERVVEQYAPPSMLINPGGEVMHYSARAGRYVQVPGGVPTSNVYRLLPEPLRLELRAAVHTAREQGHSYRSRPVAFSIASETHQVILRVEPIDQPQMDGFFLVIFDELDANDARGAETSDTSSDAGSHDAQLELEQTKRRMHALIEDHDASQQRMQAYNEELVSANEELRSTMEELETSKEEMQSMNEELTTLNQENLQKVEELDLLSSDLHSLLTATDIATVFVNRDLKIRRFTPAMATMLNLSESDRGRRLPDLTQRLNYGQLQDDCQSVLDQLSPIEREITSDLGRWYIVRLQCYRTGDNRIEGVVITFIDITDRKEAERQIREARDTAEKIIDTVRNPMLVLNEDLRVRSANGAFRDYFLAQPQDIEGVLIYELNDGRWNIPQLRELLEAILPKERTLEDFELEHEFDGRGLRSLLLNARQIDHVQLILLAFEDVTERKQTRQALEREVALRTGELRKQAGRLRSLVRDLASAEQRERKRMASALHDDLQQLLVSAKMQLDMTRHRNRDEAVSPSLEAALHAVGEAIESTRTLIRRAAPRILYDDGLVPALRWLSDEMDRRHGLHVEVEAGEEDVALGDEAKTLLFESVREMLFNVVKHAKVEQAIVAVRQEDQELKITVSDQGVGFDAEAAASQRNRSDFGVFSWGNRIEALGGRWSIDSAPGQGTRIDINLLPASPPAEEEQHRAPTRVASHSSSTSGVERTEGQVSVLVVDDHTLVRNGIVAILHGDPRLVVVGEAGNGIEAIAAVQQSHPDVVLMDVNMPLMNGVEATRQICERYPGTLVLGLSMQDEGDAAARAMIDAGASTFLSKGVDPERMIETILHWVQHASSVAPPTDP